MDPQGHATLGLLKDPSRLEKTIYEVLNHDSGTTTLKDIIIHVRENLDLAPADVLLSALPEKLRELPAREDRLSQALEQIRDEYDYVIVDCPPSVGLLTFNALKACSEALIPVEPSFFSLQGIARQLETLDLLARKTGHEIDARALVTLYSTRSEFTKGIAEEIRRHLEDRSFTTVIRFSVKLPESAGHAVPICDFSPHSAGFRDYRALAREIIAREATESVASGVEETEDVPVQESSVQPEDAAAPAESQAESKENLSSATPSPAISEEGVLFTLEAPDARCVQLAGDFNGWEASGNEMELDQGVWKKVVPLQPGHYLYRFVVDGNWMTDPLNLEVEPTPWGGDNSVLVLEGNEARDV
jgi:chromosome partitioning protein